IEFRAAVKRGSGHSEKPLLGLFAVFAGNFGDRVSRSGKTKQRAQRKTFARLICGICVELRRARCVQQKDQGCWFL
ncbi:MAG: hypothetical protein ABIU63_08805, partial [Chitinophagaceae bacterium]